ncbi:MAG: hypothetical protein K2O14_07470 [Oscillospiraceae bacterium]|nr:hypothetical protein [Oscillospiraceae bacterium]
MKTIRIISGAYGLDNDGFIKAKTKNDPPFAVDCKEADRLVALGIAEIVEKAADAPVKAGVDHKPDSFSVDDTSGAESEQGGDSGDNTEDELGDAVDIPEYNLDMNVNELRAIAKDVGISFKVGTTKEEMVEELDKYFEENGGFDLNVEEPVE